MSFAVGIFALVYTGFSSSSNLKGFHGGFSRYRGADSYPSHPLVYSILQCLAWRNLSSQEKSWMCIDRTISMKSCLMTKPKHGGKTRNKDQSSTRRKTCRRKEVKEYTVQKKEIVKEVVQPP